MNRTQIREAVRRLWTLIAPPLRKALIANFLGMISDREKLISGIPSALGFLENVRRAGWLPNTIIDVGANVGSWSSMATQIFPDANVCMFDANPDYEPHLRRLQSLLGKKAKYAIALLGARDREAVTFYKLGTGSSILPELTTFERTTVTLPMSTLDGVMSDHLTAILAIPPLLLKLDVQGSELEVLRGAQQILSMADVVILETSLIAYNVGSPLFAEVVAFMRNEGFVVFDFCGHARREEDLALYQTDVAFVRPESGLRAPRKFWLHEP